MGKINIQLVIRPTALYAPQLMIEGKARGDENTSAELEFFSVKEANGKMTEEIHPWACTQLQCDSGVLVPYQAGGVSLSLSKEKDFSFEMVLTESWKLGVGTLYDRENQRMRANYVTKFRLGSLYPFIARDLNLMVRVKSPNNFVTATMEVQLPSNMVAYAIEEKQEQFELYGQTKEGPGGRKTYARLASDQKAVTLDFSRFTYRFKPFSVFRMAIMPALYMFLSALVTLAIAQASGSEISYAARLAIFITNAGAFASISRVQSFQTQTVIEGMKLVAWLLSASIMLQFSFPTILLPINLPDFLLKAAIIWVAWCGIVSVYPYSFVSDGNSRDNKGVILLFIFGGILVVWWILSGLGIAAPLPFAEDLVRLATKH